MNSTHSNDLTTARINYSKLLVLACGGKEAAISTPVYRLHRVVVTRDDTNGLGLLQIPENHLKIGARAEYDIFGRWMPLNLIHLALVAVQVNDPVV